MVDHISGNDLNKPYALGFVRYPRLTIGIKGETIVLGYLLDVTEQSLLLEQGCDAKNISCGGDIQAEQFSCLDGNLESPDTTDPMGKSRHEAGGVTLPHQQLAGPLHQERLGLLSCIASSGAPMTITKPG